MQIKPIRGKNNLADLFTKAVSGRLREKFFKALGFVHRQPSSVHKDVLLVSRGQPREAQPGPQSGNAIVSLG